MATQQLLNPAVLVGFRVRYPGHMASPGGKGVVVEARESAWGLTFDVVLEDGRRINGVTPAVFEGLRPWQALDLPKAGAAEVEQFKARAAAYDAQQQLQQVMGAEQFKAREAARVIVDAPLFYWNGIKDAKGAKLQRAWYSLMGDQGSVSGRFPAGTITVYAKGYAGFSDKVRACFEVENDTDLMTDYFDEDTVRVIPAHPLYPQVRKAWEAQEAHRAKRAAKRAGGVK